ncbi:MAG: hypothetical protein P9M14_14145 [Candidatus Alcyoniella australis]|nr:hypothetical protein [Candidatus Alcyoniella australis]
MRAAVSAVTALLMLLALLASVAVAQEEPTVAYVDVGIGTLRIGGLLQGGLDYHIGDESLGQGALSGQAAAVDRYDLYEFVLRRARLNFGGQIVSNRVGYFAQLEFANEARLLDAEMKFHYIPDTTIRIGRFLPNFTIFMSRSASDLYLIEYPLMLSNPYAGYYGVLAGAEAPGWAASFAPWRQTGLAFAVRTKYIDADVGVFNGADNGDDLGDNNAGKDFQLSIAGKPPLRGMKIHAGLWYGMPLNRAASDAATSGGDFEEKDDTVAIFGGGVEYVADFGLRVFAEFYQRDWQNGDGDADPSNVTSSSAYGLVGYNLNPFTGVPVEFLARYDWFDPDTRNSDDGGKDDELAVITGGLNYYIEGNHAMLSINYIYRSETFEVLQLDEQGTQDGLANDEVKAQIQIAF